MTRHLPGPLRVAKHTQDHTHARTPRDVVSTERELGRDVLKSTAAALVVVGTFVALAILIVTGVIG